jgi:hypothetical protein
LLGVASQNGAKCVVWNDETYFLPYYSAVVVDGAKSYNQHSAWKIMRMKLEGLETSRFSSPRLEEARDKIIHLIERALESQKNNQPLLYDDVLEALAELANGISTDERAFSYWFDTGSLREFASCVRALPGPRPRQIPNSYLQVLDDAIDARAKELDEVRSMGASLRQEMQGFTARAEKMQQDASRALKRIDEARAVTENVATTTQGTIDKSLQLRLEDFDRKTEQARNSQAVEVERQLNFLATAGQLGHRLLESAAGNLSALDWTTRATRERRSANTLRKFALLIFAVAGLVAGAVLIRALIDGFDLTVGDGILRAVTVLSLGAIGGYLATEARRHFKEADSAEELATALSVLEPFYASATAQERQVARSALGETVFVRNIVSRLASRDASKGNNVNSQEVNAMLEQILKGVELAQKASDSK